MSAAPLLAVARTIRTATLFRSQFVAPEELPTLEAAAARVREIAGPGPLTLVVGRSAYPELDPFWTVNVRTAAGRLGEFVCAVADRWHDEIDAQAGRKILQAALA